MKDLKPAGLNKDEGVMGTPTNESIGIHDSSIGDTMPDLIGKEEGYLESPSK